MENTTLINEYKNTSSFRDYFNLIRLNIGLIIVIGLTGFIIGLVYALNAPNIYKSTTVLKITKPQGSILNSPLIPEFQDYGSDRFIANEIEILKSYKLREKVAQSLIDTFKLSDNKRVFKLIVNNETGVLPALLEKKEIIDLLENRVNISQKRGLDIVEIEVDSPSPKEAAIIANCYAAAYKELNLEYNREQLTYIRKFLEQQRNEKLTELSQVEDALRSYQEQKGIVQLPEQARALIEQTTDFESKMNATKIDLTITEKTLNQYKAELAKKDPNINEYIESFATEPYIKNLQLQIADLMTQKDRALSNNKDTQRKNQIIKEFDSKINELKEKLNSQLAIYRAGILAASPEEIKELTKKVLEEEVKYQSLLASYRKLNEIVSDYDKRLSKLPTSSIDLARLTRQQSAYEKLYLQVEEKYQEAIINEQSVPGNVLIVDPALIPTKPSKPNRPLIVILGLILGFGIGISIAFIKNHFDNTVKTPEDLQNRNISILAWIPQIEGFNNNNKDLEFIIAKKPDASASEAYKVLRTRIKFSKIDKELLKTILVTSSRAFEGKTTTCINLAGSFAIANHKTLILDADLRKPKVHSVFNEKRYPGFTDYFFGQATYDQIIRKTILNNLYYISAGTIPPNPSEILSSPQMISFFEKLKNDFDYIILDSAPLIAVSDSEILARIVDGTILVVSANNTEIDLLEKSIDLINRDNITFLGTVLNNFTYRSGYGSYYKYYYYYSSPSNGSNKDKVKVT